MFRCPTCGKVHKLHLSETYSLLSNKNMDTYYVVKEPFYKDGNLAKALANMHPVSNLLEATEYIVKQGELPYDDWTCSACNHTHTPEYYEEAFHSPMDFFDAENLCSCGGELWMDRIPYTNRYGLVCDKCDWIKPKVTVSGSEDATVK